MAALVVVVSVVSAWLASQLLKMLFAKRVEKFFELGGMPSSHTAFVSALSTSVGLAEGFSSAVFLVSLGFSLIVAHDAVKVRKHHTIADVVVGALVGIVVSLLVRNVIV